MMGDDDFIAVWRKYIRRKDTEATDWSRPNHAISTIQTTVRTIASSDYSES